MVTRSCLIASGHLFLGLLTWMKHNCVTVSLYPALWKPKYEKVVIDNQNRDSGPVKSTTEAYLANKSSFSLQLIPQFPGKHNNLSWNYSTFLSSGRVNLRWSRAISELINKEALFYASNRTLRYELRSSCQSKTLELFCHQETLTLVCNATLSWRRCSYCMVLCLVVIEQMIRTLPLKYETRFVKREAVRCVVCGASSHRGCMGQQLMSRFQITAQLLTQLDHITNYSSCAYCQLSTKNLLNKYSKQRLKKSAYSEHTSVRPENVTLKALKINVLCVSCSKIDENIGELSVARTKFVLLFPLITGRWLSACLSTEIQKGALKMTDMKMTDQIAGHENAGRETAGHEIAGHKIARHDKYLFVVVSANPSNFSSTVKIWCNVYS